MDGTAQQANVDRGEIDKFSRLAEKWWDTEGEFKPLHDINPFRLDYIDAKADLAGKTVLDVGCGGGILSEAWRGAVRQACWAWTWQNCRCKPRRRTPMPGAWQTLPTAA